MKNDSILKKPEWIKVRLGQGPEFTAMRRLIRTQRLHTVCEEAMCPNRGECWGHGRATIMILGEVCTRACTFCAVGTRRPELPDAEEPVRVAEAVCQMGLRDVVLTSVTRDDLEDGGSILWAETIRQVRAMAPGILIEVLIPDFGGCRKALDKVISARPDILGHNLETVPALYQQIRPQADYRRSLELLQRAHEAGMIVKTGIMLGLGETFGEVMALMQDARQAGADVFYMGQYLQPSRAHVPVVRYVEPGEFQTLRKEGLAMGFRVVVAAPLVRSSYHSEEQTEFMKNRQSGHR